MKLDSKLRLILLIAIVAIYVVTIVFIPLFTIGLILGILVGVIWVFMFHPRWRRMEDEETHQNTQGGPERIMKKENVGFRKTPFGDEPFCKKCGSDVSWVDCENCGGTGSSHHDCGEDTCCCRYPENNVPCDWCDGEGGHYHCFGCEGKTE